MNRGSLAYEAFIPQYRGIVIANLISLIESSVMKHLDGAMHVFSHASLSYDIS